jgi:hypothetical protein
MIVTSFSARAQLGFSPSSTKSRMTGLGRPWTLPRVGPFGYFRRVQLSATSASGIAVACMLSLLPRSLGKVQENEDFWPMEKAGK